MKRIIWLDVLKFIAIFMVICVHCSDPFNVSPEARSNPDFNFWGNIYGSFLRPCVPLFVMITGALLLPVKLSMKDFYKKRLLRIAFPFIIWSILYNLFPWFTGVLGLPNHIISDIFVYAPSDASQTFSDALKNILLIPIQFSTYTVPMWYLYMLIGIYLYMPILSSWIEKANSKQKQFMLGLWAITLLLPYAYSFYSADLLGTCAWNSFGTLYYFAGFSGYLLLGHFIFKELKDYNLGKTLLMALPMLAMGYAITYMGFKNMTAQPDCSEHDLELFFLYCSPNVALMTIAWFLIIRKVKIQSPRAISALTSISKCALGIYMVHYFVVGFGYAIATSIAIPVSVRIPATATITFFICWGFVALGYKIMPKYAKWIFG
mgnify:FL=1